MAEQKTKKGIMHLRHRGRQGQVRIYLGKLLRMFLYQNDWKVLPMSALIAGLVAFVIRKDFGVSMEGTLKGSFSLTCVAIWNGCFNSIQSVCRERNIVKREHRSGMHISSYIAAHMIYQALICLAQTAITIYICIFLNVPFPEEGLLLHFSALEIGITIFLISYASDMCSLFISSLVHTTTTAMTVMPFILIFQLVFSGGMMNSLPQWADPVTRFTISSYGVKCLNSQCDYNGRPLAIGWKTLERTMDREIELKLTVGDILDFLDDDGTGGKSGTIGSIWNAVNTEVPWTEARSQVIKSGYSIGQILEFLKGGESAGSTTGGQAQADRAAAIDRLIELAKKEQIYDLVSQSNVTYGEALDYIVGLPELQKERDKELKTTTTVRKLIDMVGREKVEDLVKNRTAESSYNAKYESTIDNLTFCWFSLVLFIIAFSLMAVIVLEFIDKDKR